MNKENLVEDINDLRSEDDQESIEIADKLETLSEIMDLVFSGEASINDFDNLKKEFVTEYPDYSFPNCLHTDGAPANNFIN